MGPDIERRTRERNYQPGREVRITSPTGGQKGQKSIRLGGADPLAMLELGRVYGIGETKYDRFNYLKGYAWSLSIDALKRHLLAFEAGQDYDDCSVHPNQYDDDHEFDPAVCDGSGLLHVAHVAWHGLALTSFLIRMIGEDDRAPRPTTPLVALVAGDRKVKPERVNDAVRFFMANPGAELPEEWLLPVPESTGTPCPANCGHFREVHDEKSTGMWCRTCMDLESNAGFDPNGVGPCW